MRYSLPVGRNRGVLLRVIYKVSQRMDLEIRQFIVVNKQ